MSTPFSFESVLEARSVNEVVAAYFDADHLAAQDRVAELCDRTVVEEHEDETTRSATWSVRAMRPLPVFARPFIEGGRIVYRETLVWRKRDHEIDLTIVPQILGGRISIAAHEKLVQAGEREVRRHYFGEIAVDVALLSATIERRIVAEIAKQMPAMRDCTQAWLHQRMA